MANKPSDDGEGDLLDEEEKASADLDAKLAAAAAKPKHDNLAKARAAKAAAREEAAKKPERQPAGPPKQIDIPAAKVELANPKNQVSRAIPKPTLAVTAPPGTEEEEFEEDDATAKLPARAVRRAAKPAKRSKNFTAAQLKILDSIRAESEARVNIDDFLATKDKDQHHVPEHLIPDGFAVEWKNTHVGGKPVDGTYNSFIQSAGWRPAPTELFQELVPEGYDLPFIEKAGSMLYIRPIEISEAIKNAEYEAAIAQVQDKMASLTQAPAKENPRFVKAFSRDYERRMPVMPDK